MNEHDWLGSGTASCNRCNLVRMKRGGVMKYCTNGTSGPWIEEAPTCDVRRAVPGVGKKVVTLESLAGGHVGGDVIEAEFVDDGPAGNQIEHGWRARKILMVDVETTGLDWTRDDVVEIGMVAGELRYSGDGLYRAEVIGRFQSLVRPAGLFLNPLEEKFELVKEITGIERSELYDAPALMNVVSLIHDFIAEHDAADAVFASYNAEFDQPFVAAMFLHVRSPVPTMFGKQQPHLDPFIWVQKFDKYVKGQGRHKLMATAQRYGLVSGEEVVRAHRADFDADVALRVLAALADRVPSDIEDLMDWQKSARGMWMAEFFGSYMPRKRAEERTRKLASSDICE